VIELHLNQDFTHSAKECATQQENIRTCSTKSLSPMTEQRDHRRVGEVGVLSGSSDKYRQRWHHTSTTSAAADNRSQKITDPLGALPKKMHLTNSRYIQMFDWILQVRKRNS
jgi:hypothetical protein